MPQSRCVSSHKDLLCPSSEKDWPSKAKPLDSFRDGHKIFLRSKSPFCQFQLHQNELKENISLQQNLDKLNLKWETNLWKRHQINEKIAREFHLLHAQNQVREILSVFTKSIYTNIMIEHKQRRQSRNKWNTHNYNLVLGRTINTKSTPPDTNKKESERSSPESIKFDFQDSNHHQTPTNQDEYYNYIELLQRKRGQALRAKTSINIQRALYGNCIIAVAKLGAWASSGSSAMLSEFVHSLVDCGNQALLLLGLRDSGLVADRKHQYGYGKSMYFWALVSALGTFWLGAGVSMRHSVEELMNPSLQDITWHVWGVLGLSLAIDGWVFYRTLNGVWDSKPENKSFYKHVVNLRDPATLAILLEDGAACLGIIIASTGICLTAVSGSPIFDGLAGVGISGLLAGMGLILVRLNQRFLLGQSVDPEIIAGIEKILLRRRSIDGVHSVQSQWTGPDSFSYKAEVDFDGTFLAAKLMPRYQKEFMEAKESLDQDLHVLLSWYAEDIMRAVEREIRHIEAEVRKEYPGAAFIELEPDSKDADRFAIDDGMETKLRKVELEVLNRYLKSLYVGGLTADPKSKQIEDRKSPEEVDLFDDSETSFDAEDLKLSKSTSFRSGTFQSEDESSPKK